MSLRSEMQSYVSGGRNLRGDMQSYVTGGRTQGLRRSLMDEVSGTAEQRRLDEAERRQKAADREAKRELRERERIERAARAAERGQIAEQNRAQRQYRQQANEWNRELKRRSKAEFEEKKRQAEAENKRKIEQSVREAKSIQDAARKSIQFAVMNMKRDLEALTKKYSHGYTDPRVKESLANLEKRLYPVLDTFLSQCDAWTKEHVNNIPKETLDQIWQSMSDAADIYGDPAPDGTPIDWAKIETNTAIMIAQGRISEKGIYREVLSQTESFVARHWV